MRRTLEGTKRKRQNVSGFRARMATHGGREVLNRIEIANKNNVAITNYGIAIAKCTGILKRAIKPLLNS